MTTSSAASVQPDQGLGVPAVGLPIIAADLPSLHEVLGPEEACWYQPGDPDSLLRRCVAPWSQRAEARRRLRSWRDRASEILALLEAALP